jgi:hypothetical protein
MLDFAQLTRPILQHIGDVSAHYGEHHRREDRGEIDISPHAYGAD